VDFGLTDDQQLFHETTRKFLEATSSLDAVRRVALEQPDGFDRAWWRRGAELGWVSMLVAEEHGGGSVSGGGLADLALVAEEFGRLVTPGPLIPTNVVAAALSRTEGPAHHKLLDGLVGGETIASWCPPGDPTHEGLRVTAHGDGYVIEGTSVPVEAAAQADLVLVTARSDEGLSQFVVPAGTPGLTVHPAESIDLVRRFATLEFDSVEVGSDSLLGRPGDAGPDVERQLQDAVVLQCAEMAGAIDQVFTFTVEYAEDRYSFGRPLVSYQALKHRFADMKMWIEASHATTAAAARAVDSESPLADELVSVAKSYIGDHGPFILQECVQLHGGIGVTWDHDLHLYLRRVVLDRSQFGTPRDHRERIVAGIGI
jgi:alkylation response protein AidB-like acyl-CoA dehydrogenase